MVDDESINNAVEEMIGAMRRRKATAAHDDLLLIIPLISDETMVVAFPERNDGSAMGKSPELALAIAQKNRCKTPTYDSSTRKELSKLNEALCTFERETSREYVVIYVPQCKTEAIEMSRNGLPYPHDMTVEEVLAMAMIERRGE